MNYKCSRHGFTTYLHRGKDMEITAVLYCICHGKGANELRPLIKCVHRKHERDFVVFMFVCKAVESSIIASTLSR